MTFSPLECTSGAGKKPGMLSGIVVIPASVAAPPQPSNHPDIKDRRETISLKSTRNSRPGNGGLHRRTTVMGLYGKLGVMAVVD